MAVVSLRTLATVLVATIAASSLLLSGGTWWLAARIADGQEQWRAYRDANAPEAIALVDLGAHLGYGGAIHHLKNYVLRGDQVHMERMRTSIGGARAALDRYRTAAPSGEEVAALDAIEATLAELEQAAAAALVLIVEAKAPREIHRSLPLDVRPAMDAMTVLENAVQSQRAPRVDQASKLQLLYELRRAIGFGGMIHAYKDLVLSGDSGLLGEVRDRIRAAKAAVGRYRALAVDEDEADALAGIDEMLDRYSGKAELAASMAADGANALSIDAAVRVSERMTLSGLSTLELAIARQADARARRIDGTLHFVGELSSGLLATAVAVGIDRKSVV